MVDFSYGERETELGHRTEAFIRDVVIPYERDRRLTLHGLSQQLLDELHARARTAGLLSPHVGTEWGGLGLSHRECATVFRASGYSLLGPLAMNCMAPDEGNMHLLELVATREQQQRYLRPLAAGECRSSFLMTEPDPGAGSDPEGLATVARQDGDHWVIDGHKWFITGAIGARFGIVMARAEAGATLFLTDMNAPGINVVRALETFGDIMPGGHCLVELKGLRVHRSQVLGAVGEGFRTAQVRLAPARLTHCMRWWGAARRAHDIATAYAMRRRAFGKPLIEHEGVGFALARNHIDLRQCQLLIDYVAWMLDQGGKAKTESSMAKYSCAETLFAVVDRCVQILGGQGVTHETIVGRIYQEIRAFRIYDGPSEVHLWSLARHVGRSWQRSQRGATET
jgi:acyl-CoA dehydrogenase